MCVFFLALRIETVVNTRIGVNTELKNPGNLIMRLLERPISGCSHISKSNTTTRRTSFDRYHTERGQAAVSTITSVIVTESLSKF